MSSHGIDLPVVGGNTYVAPGTHPELAAAAVDPHNVVLNVGGESIVAPMSQVDTDKVELACNQEGCALILDDGNAYNDIQVQSANPNALQPQASTTQASTTQASTTA